jgi:hypothetical protein
MKIVQCIAKHRHDIARADAISSEQFRLVGPTPLSAGSAVSRVDQVHERDRVIGFCYLGSHANPLHGRVMQLERFLGRKAMR